MQVASFEIGSLRIRSLVSRMCDHKNRCALLRGMRRAQPLVMRYSLME